jgi:hypothetical protein
MLNVSRASAPHAPRDRNASLLLFAALLKRLKATFLFASETPQRRRRRPISSTNAAMCVCVSNICSARATQVAAARQLMRAPFVCPDFVT